MMTARVKHQNFTVFITLLVGMVVSSVALQGCQIEESTTGLDYLSTSTSVSPIPISDAENIPAIFPATSTTEAYEPGYGAVWEGFSPPSIDPATPIPPPITDLNLPDEVLVWLLLGSDTEPPFTGRTQAVHLLFIHPRFSKASLVSIPGDLYVYIPGFTMQRLNTAYAVGGIETLRETIRYNFGVTPNRFVLAHPGDFQWLVDDINGIDVTVFYPMPQACGGIRAGLIHMDGAMALCYSSYREDMDEIDRMRRQQQLLRIIFNKLTHEGRLSLLPVLYASYDGWIKTDLSLAELLDFIPLALRLADPDRIAYFMVGWDQVTLWEVPGYNQAQVFLPNQEGVKAVLQQAIDVITSPSPLTDLVQTLEAQLTAVYISTIAPSSTSTPTSTPTPEITSTLETPIPYETPTPPGYP